MTRDEFGPWATALDTGPGAGLSTFWQRRMAMLPILNSATSRVSKRAYFCLAALAAVALALPLIYVAQASSTSSADSAKEPAVEFLPRISASEEKILAVLEQPTAFEFVDTSLKDVMGFIQDKHAIEIHLDRKALEEAGVGEDTPVTIHIKSVSLGSALRVMLEAYDLRYIVRNQLLQITTAEKASNELITRTYPVGDLTEDNDYDSLVNTITETVKPVTWDEVGGPGSISPMRSSQSLVISQTDDVHDEVLQLLRSLRAARKAQPARPISKEPKVQVSQKAGGQRVKGGGMGGGMGGMGGGMSGGTKSGVDGKTKGGVDGDAKGETGGGAKGGGMF